MNYYVVIYNAVLPLGLIVFPRKASESFISPTVKSRYANKESCNPIKYCQICS